MRFFSLLAALFLLSACGPQTSDEIEFFTHNGCPYCEKALKFIQINYPKLPIKVMEISSPQNMKKFVRCAKKFQLNTQQLGTPLICMKKHYLMGWNQENQDKFNTYVKEIIKK